MQGIPYAPASAPPRAGLGWPGAGRVSAPAKFFAAVYFLSILVSPFNSIKGVPALGELGGDTFSILHILLFPFVVTSLLRAGQMKVDAKLWVFSLALTIGLAAGLLANFPEIATAADKGRSGFNKFVTSALVLYAGLYFTLLTSIAARLDLRALFVKPLLIITAFTMLVGCVEFAAWHSSAVERVYLVFSHVVHSGNARGQYAPGRIHSVTLEPSFFGAFVVFATPWLLMKIVEKRGDLGALLGYVGLLALTMALSLLSGRTSQIGGPATVAVFVLCLAAFKTGERAFLFVRFLLTATLVLGIAAPLFYINTHTAEMVQKMVESNNISNVTRFATTVINIKLATEYPVFGVGMGQYGFHVPTHVPDWAMNFEFKRWMTDPTSSFFPSFALTARLAGELGAYGLLVWLAFNAVLLNNVLAAARRYQVRTGLTPLVGVAVATEFFGSVLYGWSAGSLRALNLWGAFGLSLAYEHFAEKMESALPGRAAPASGLSLVNRARTA